jgi:hypothetical protein
VTDADQHDGSMNGDTQYPGDLAGQSGGVITHAADAVRTQVGQVLAQRGRIDAGGRGQRLGGAGGDLLVDHVREHTKIGREPRYRRLGNMTMRFAISADRVAGRAGPLGTGGLNATVNGHRLLGVCYRPTTAVLVTQTGVVGGP